MSLFSESLIFDLIAIFVTIFIGIYFYVTRKFKYWEEQNVPYVKPVAFLGSLKDVFLQRLSMGEEFRNIYNNYRDVPYVGVYSFDRPSLILRDLDYVKKVLVKDSHNFFDRLMTMDEELDPLGARNMFVMTGDKWRHIRTNLSPTFTSGKMKKMFYLVQRCADELVLYLDKATEKGAPIQLKESMSKFTVDVIASCAFGIDSNSLKDESSEFAKQLRKVFEVTPLRSIALFASLVAPTLLKVFRLQVIDPSVNSFLRETVWTTVAYREHQGVVRKDFLDNLIELRRKGKEEMNMTNKDDEQVNFVIDGDDFVAQALSFLTAGFETSSSTMTFALYELSLNPEIQQRLREEIGEVISKHNGQVTYDAIQDMVYLDMVVSETLRKYPVVTFLERKTNSDYKISSATGGSDVIIPAGAGVYIPVLGIHFDEEYYPESENFDPERFTEENKLKRSKYSYLPFGEGPRFCIGMRFGLMQTKTGLIAILKNYEVHPSKDTPIPLTFDPKTFLLAPSKTIPLIFRRVEN